MNLYDVIKKMCIRDSVYSVPAFGSEWYSRNMYIQGNPCYDYHREHFGDQAGFCLLYTSASEGAVEFLRIKEC